MNTQIAQATSALALNRRRGRPRKWINAAEKQTAYRTRLEAKQANDARLAEIRSIAGKFPSAEFHPNRGCFMVGAPAGRGLLVTGGYGATELDNIDAAHRIGEPDGDFDGIPAQPVSPKGRGPDDNRNLREEPDESEYLFHKNKKFPGYMGLSPDEADVVRRFLAENITLSAQDPVAPSYSCQLCLGRFHHWLDAARHVETQHRSKVRRVVTEYRNKPKSN